jgi:hypothetical protein
MNNSGYDDIHDIRCDDIDGYSNCFEKIKATCLVRDVLGYDGLPSTCNNHQNENCTDDQQQVCFVPYRHYKYDMRIAIGTEESNDLTIGYSIEPFGTPLISSTDDEPHILSGSDTTDFYSGKTAAEIRAALNTTMYDAFIMVEENQFVEKGDIIAYHYIDSDNEESLHAHIHYNLWRYVDRHLGSSFVAATIFSDSVIENISSYFVTKDDDKSVCHALYLADSENLFDQIEAIDPTCINR